MVERGVSEVDACADELVRDHVARRDLVCTRRDRALPEALQAAGDEHERALVIEPLGHVAYPLGREDGQLPA